MQRRSSATLFVFLGFTSFLFAGESAILQSGREIHVDRHEVSDGMVRLYSGSGVIELPQAAISSYAPDEPLPPPPPAPMLASSTTVPEPREKEIPKDPRTLVRGAAVRAGLPPAFVESVAKTESAMNPRAVSSKGALGVMQLMPETAKAMGADPNDLEQNIDAGTRLLRDLLIRYNGDVVKALAAYNAGSAAVDHYNGLPPYAETQNYVNKVIHGYLDAKP